MASLSQDFALTATTAAPATTFADEFSVLDVGTTWRVGLTQGAYLEGNTWIATPAQASDVYSINNNMLQLLFRTGVINNSTYVGGQISTASFSQQYGYFECRASMQKARGTGFAFWMLPTDGTDPPECDIIEIPCFATNSTFDAQCHLQSAFIDAYQGNFTIDATQFHTYGVDWNATSVTFYTDRVATLTRTTPADWKKPMYMILEMTEGGASWAGAVNTADLPAVALIDYVRVWAKKPF